MEDVTAAVKEKYGAARQRFRARAQARRVLWPDLLRLTAGPFGRLVLLDVTV